MDTIRTSRPQSLAIVPVITLGLAAVALASFAVIALGGDRGGNPAGPAIPPPSEAPAASAVTPPHSEAPAASAAPAPSSVPAAEPSTATSSATTPEPSDGGNDAMPIRVDLATATGAGVYVDIVDSTGLGADLGAPGRGVPPGRPRYAQDRRLKGARPLDLQPRALERRAGVRSGLKGRVMTQSRTGSLVAATWLIGVGAVFLIQRAADLPWSQAWPLFVILGGVASLVTTVINGRLDTSGIWGLTWPVVWIVIGVMLLLSTTGQLAEGPAELIVHWWPVLLIGLGVWFVIGAVVPAGRGLTESLSIPLDGATEAEVRIRFGAGNVTTRPAASGSLVDGEFSGGVIHRVLGPGRVELSQDTRYGMPWLSHASAWTVGLTHAVPLDLRIDAGASRAVLDLSDLRVRSLELQTGASETRVLLPRAGGATTVRAQAGAASLTFDVPQGVAARIRTRLALGSAQIDQSRFPASSGGYESADYGTATNRVDINIEGGLGSVRVVGGT